MKGRVDKYKGCSSCNKKRQAALEKQDNQSLESKVEIPARKSYKDYNSDGMDYTKVFLRTAYGQCTVAKFQSEVDGWLRAVYSHAGQSKNGTDCIGLILGCAKNLGLLPIDLQPDEYPRQWYLEQDNPVHPAFEELKKRVEIQRIEGAENFQPGDIVVFSFGKAKEAHVAWYTVRHTYVHAVASAVRGRVIETRKDDRVFSNKVYCAYRFFKPEHKETE